MYSPPPDTGLNIVYQDDSLLVIDKPAGLLSVPGRGPEKADCLAARVQARFADALVVHRLDMSTSGLLLFARGAQMQSELSRLFRERQVDKSYTAVVHGLLADDAGEVDLPLIVDWPNRPLQKVAIAFCYVMKRPTSAVSNWSRSPAVRTSCGCIWRNSATPSSATISTAARPLNAPTGCCCTPPIYA